MATKFSDLLLRIQADPSKAKAALADLNRGLVDANRQAAATTGGFRSLASSLQGIGAGGFASLTLPIVGVGAAALTMASKVESASAAFTTMTGSATKAAALLGQVQKFAATTPFEFPELVKSSQKLLGFGFAADKVIPTLRSIGNAVAAVGGGSAEIDRVTLALGQIQAKGKLSAEELNQLAETGLPVREILAKGFGITQAALADMTQKGVVPADKAIRVLLAGFDTRFTGALEAQSKTLGGIFSNMKDQVSLALIDIGAAMAPAARRIADELVTPALAKLQEFAKGFRDLSPAAQNGIIGLTAFAAAAPVVVGGVGLMIAGFTQLKAAMALTGVGLTGLSAGIAVYLGQSSAWVASLTGITASTATLTAAIAASTAAVGIGAIAIYKIVEAYNAASNAQALYEGANKLAGDGISKVRAIAVQRGADLTELDAAYKKGSITAIEYSQRLGEIVKKLTDIQGPLNPVVAKTQDLSNGLGNVAKAAKVVEAIKLPEWAKFADMSFERLLSTMPNLSEAIKDALREENFNKATAAAKATTDTIYQLITAGVPLSDSYKRSFATFVEGAKESLVFTQALEAQLSRIGSLSSKRTFAAVVESNQESQKLDPNVRALELLDIQRRQRQEAVLAKQAYDNLVVTQGKNSDVARRALADWHEAENKALGVTRTQFIEVSTVITNLSQGIARNITHWKGLGDTALGVLQGIGEAITSKLIERLLTASGVVDGFAGKLNSGLSFLTKLPVFGGKGGAPDISKVVSQTGISANGAILSGLKKTFGEAGTIATSVTEAASNAATSATKAAATAVTSSLTSVLGAVGSLGSLATGIIGNVLAYKTGKDTARIEVTSRETFAEIANLRRDEWTRFDIWGKYKDTINDSINRVGQQQIDLLKRIAGGGAVVAGAGGGGLTINVYVEGSNATPEEIATAIARRTGLQG